MQESVMHQSPEEPVSESPGEASRKRQREGRGSLSSRKAPRTAAKSGGEERQCKTCSYCRTKKIKCDSSRPSCRACLTNEVECVYPRDTRRLTRPSTDRFDDMEQKIAMILKHIVPATPQDPAATPAPIPQPLEGIGDNGGDGDGGNGGNGDDSGNVIVVAPASPISPKTSIARPEYADKASNHTPAQSLDLDHGGVDEASKVDLSPREAAIAGLDIDLDGDISVHGPTSMMHRRRDSTVNHRRSSIERRSLAAAQARLVSYAALQRQKEHYLYQSPTVDRIDFDGVDPELARHLIDLHWNRQHYAYLLTYRPAIMSSLENGGPFCSKLLLNAIFYTSSLYSDREYLRKSPDDTQTAGDRFYERYRTLLVDELDRPSIPSAASLLLMGPSLLSQGRTSAGWNLCGLAYRMVIDLGIHLTIAPRDGTMSFEGDLSHDIELEWRRRLYWGAFVVDATQSMYIGRQMTLHVDEGRVSQVFLDTFEEWEEWRPYIDSMQPAPAQSVLLGYQQKPALAVSTFTAMIGLMKISAKITRTFYNIRCIKQSREELLQLKANIQNDLSSWSSNLPDSLKHKTEGTVPPPHQITPHTTYHILNILLDRPFSTGGYLEDYASEEEKKLTMQNSMEHAYAIWRLVSDYRDTHTLRRAPFLLSYAVFSAAIVFLRQSKTDPDACKVAIGFFLTALSELQHGCNVGLRKPVAIIREMMGEIVIQETPVRDMLQPLTEIDYTLETSPIQPVAVDLFSDLYPDTIHQDPSPTSFLEFMGDQELYGLFAQEPGAWA